MGSTQDFRNAFVDRLKNACDASPDVPPPHKGRQQYLADKLEVAPEAVSKWFRGVALPRPDRMEDLARLLKVEATWLTNGLKPEMDRTEREQHGRELDGAVHLVMGLLKLAGFPCGLPPAKDSRSVYVDFYATVRGSVVPVRVTLARPKGQQYEVTVPKQYDEVAIVCVINHGKGRYQLLEMPHSIIATRGVRSNTDYLLTMNTIEGGHFASGTDYWPKFKFFADPR